MVMVSVLACGAAYGQPVEPAPVRSTVPKDAIDLEASRAFPKHDKPFYVADRAKAIYGQLHIAGPMRPHTRWRTGETSGDRVHIRIAFNRPVEIGCLIGGDGWEVATLSSDAPAPGDVNDEQQWRPVPDVPGQAGLRVLPLPRQIETWAIRLTRRRPEDKTGAWRGELPGLLILDRRLHNWTPEAVAFASTPPPESEQARQRHGVANLVEGGVFSAWPAKTISPDEPARVVLRWDEPRPVRVIGLRDAFADRVEFDIYTGPADTHPLTASPEHWRHVGGMNPPVWWRPAYADGYVDLGETFETSALRVRFTRPLTDENPDVARVTRREPNLVRLGGLMAMGDLGDAPAPARPEPAPPRPVLSVDYRMPFDGKVAVAIDDEHGHRVRNLIADVERGAGQLSEPWDGLDEMGQPVPAGTYTVKTIAHQPLSLRWRMTPNNARDIPWWTRSTWGGIAGPGSFLSDHAPPRSVATVGEQVFIGAAVAESGHSLVALDLDGTKLWGTKWLETAGASHLATDGQTLYVGAEGGWIRDQVMIFALDPQTYEHRRLVRFAADPTNRPGGISGLAAHEGRIFAAFNAPPYSSLAGALSTGNLDVGHCFPDGIANPRHGGEGARALGALLRAGGKPASHYELTPETVDGRPMIRIAFESPQPIGSIVLPACGTTFSALKEGVRFPGEMGDDRHWTRLPQETVGKMTVVTAPPATVTRALRLTWPADAQAPRCPGFKILPKRMINLAGEASATASSGDVQAGLAWQSEKRKDDRPITLLDPATLTARFDEPRALRGLALIHPMFKRARVEVERDGAWRDAGELTPPTWWRPSYRDAYHDLGEAMEVTEIGRASCRERV